MKAVVYEQYGGPEVLQLKEIEKPNPKSDEILIKTKATSVSAADWRLRKADPFLARIFNGLFRPKRVKVLGMEISGVIEKVGKSVHDFKAGDAVFAYCGYKFGGYAQYCCLKESDVVAIKPTHISFEQASTVPLGALTALSFLKKSTLSSGQKILIYGASGSVGTYAVQLANYFGAEVYALCSDRNIELVSSLGAKMVLDYTTTNMDDLNQKFDVIFDAVGKLKKEVVKYHLKPSGSFVTVRKSNRPTKMDLLFIKQLVENNELISVIDRTYQLSDIVAAHTYVESFRKRGNVPIVIDD